MKYTILFFQISLLSFLIYYFSTTFWSHYLVYSQTVKSNVGLSQVQQERVDILLWIPEIRSWDSSPLFTLYLSQQEETEIVESIINQQQEILNIQRENYEPLEEFIQISIPSINLIAPTRYSRENDLNILNSELTKHIIRYSKKDIQESGVTTLFGHSSQALLSSGDYRFFRRLPSLVLGEEVLFSGNFWEKKYQVYQSLEIETSELSNIIELWEKRGIQEGKNYVILITCYPLNTTQRRWITILEQLDV